ncbi:hypothetical protein [Haladaptatus salinisoli]|uniref:hypothetical protein n=1 Tax=Haladaptatus salinisoli TaxID=2884876 RepID=UPI001D0AAF93|nr:hypothetical protein [Haladaptatus salinisoli]
MRQESRNAAVLHDRFPGIGGGERFDSDDFDAAEIRRFAERYDRATFADSLLNLVNRTRAEAASKRSAVDDDTETLRVS